MDPVIGLRSNGDEVQLAAPKPYEQEPQKALKMLRLWLTFMRRQQ